MESGHHVVLRSQEFFGEVLRALGMEGRRKRNVGDFLVQFHDEVLDSSGGGQKHFITKMHKAKVTLVVSVRCPHVLLLDKRENVFVFQEILGNIECSNSRVTCLHSRRRKTSQCQVRCRAFTAPEKGTLYQIWNVCK